MIYLHLFETESGFTEQYNGTGYSEPWTSLIDETGVVKFNKIKPMIFGKYLVSTTESPTNLCSTALTNVLQTIIVDGVELEQPVTSYTFTSTGLHNVTFVLSNNSVPYLSFSGTDIPAKSLRFNGSIKSIGQYAVSGVTSVEEIIVDDGVEILGLSPFLKLTNLTKAVIPGTITSANTTDDVFQGCTSLSAITSPLAVYDGGMLIVNNKVVSYAPGYWVGKTELVIPEGVTEVCKGPGSATNLSGASISGITIPSTYTANLGLYFTSFATKEIIAYPTTAPNVSSSTFRRCANNGVLKHPAGADYSGWMKTTNYYLGSSNWTEETF